MVRVAPRDQLFPYTTLFRSGLFFRAAAASRLEIRALRKRVSSATPGVGDPCGGIAPTPSFFTTRSHRAASADRKSTRLNSSHSQISYAVFCLKKKIQIFFIT